MASIPYDPTLTLGNLCNPEKIRALADIAECNKPVIQANDSMNNMMLTNYKFKMIYESLYTMGVSYWDIFWLWLEMKLLQNRLSAAAQDWATKVVIAEMKIKLLKDAWWLGMGLAAKQGQSQIGMQPASPVDFELSKIKKFPLSFDSIKFDVQYFRNESQSSMEHSATVTASMSASASMQGKGGAEASASMSAMTSSQVSNHNIEGTLCITANSTHRNACIIAPLVIDPVKAVAAWNYTFPWDPIGTDPFSLQMAALVNFSIPFFSKPKLHILSGVTRGSSFMGFVHIKKEEFTATTTAKVETAASVKANIEQAMYQASLTGSFGASALSRAMTSISKIQNGVSLVSNGVIPTIKTNVMTSTVNTLKPTPNELMNSITTVNDSSGGAENGNFGQGAKVGQQYMEMTNSFLKSAVDSLGEQQNQENQVIDTNSMFTAFTDYVDKCIEGNCGVPINFYTTQLTKADVAKCYIRKFYPNGFGDPEENKKAQLGLTGQDGGGS